MIEVEIDSVRISLISQHRIVMLRELNGERQLAIWIGPCEAEAITIELQDTEIARPMTHDLLKNVVDELGGSIAYVLINDMNDGVYYARLVLEVDGGKQHEIDCRPSDALAVAVRAKVAIYIAESVMDEVGVLPEPDISSQADEDEVVLDEDSAELDAFRSFVDTLDFDDFED